jgi:DNA polymerase-1
VQALAGDSVDNVPGVPGIGIKTAAQLITEYGDLETLLARAGEIKQPKRRESLIEHAEKARISRQLVLLDDKVKLDVPLDDLAVQEPDARKLVAFLKAMEFTTLTRRVAEYAQVDLGAIEPDASVSSGSPQAEKPGRDLFGSESPASSPANGTTNTSVSTKAGQQNLTPADLASARAKTKKNTPVDRKKYTTVRNLDDLQRFIARIHDAGHVAIDAKATSIDPMQADIVGIALALGPNDACYVPLAHKNAGEASGLFDAGLAPDQIKASDALAALKPLFESAGLLKIGHNIKFNAVLFAQHGITLRNQDDVQLMSYALDAGRKTHSVETLAENWLGHTTIAFGDLIGSGRNKLSFEQVAIDKATEYAGESADVIHRLAHVLKPRLVSERMMTVYETLERPLVSVLTRMERRGISIDRQVLSRLSSEFAQTAARVEGEIREIAGEDINPGSPKQLGDIMFGKMGLPGGKKTKTGAWSTSASILDELAEIGHDFPKKVLEWRQVSKLRSTYTDALPEYVHPQTHRVHTTYALAATTTGRLSSNEPNLQNIPVRTEDGRKIRKAFIAAKGHIFRGKRNSHADSFQRRPAGII